MSELATAPRERQGKKVVCFWLGKQQFAAPIGEVKETIVLRPITRVFLTPRFVAGIINLRGDVVAVLDLSEFLGLGATEIGADTRIVIARAGDGTAKTAGILVDRLAEVRWLDDGELEAPPPTVAPAAAELLAGVKTLEGGAPLCVLDLARLFGSERLRQFQRKA